MDIHDVGRMVCDLVVNGAWNVQSIYTTLPAEVLAQLYRINPTIVPDREGAWTWETNSRGIYTMRDTYKSTSSSKTSNKTLLQ